MPARSQLSLASKDVLNETPFHAIHGANLFRKEPFPDLSAHACQIYSLSVSNCERKGINSLNVEDIFMRAYMAVV